MTKCARVAVNPYSRIPAMPANVNAAADIVSIDAELGNIGKAIRSRNGEAMPGCLLSDQALARGLSIAAAYAEAGYKPTSLGVDQGASGFRSSEPTSAV